MMVITVSLGPFSQLRSQRLSWYWQSELANQHSYRQWLTEQLIRLKDPVFCRE